MARQYLDISMKSNFFIKLQLNILPNAAKACKLEGGKTYESLHFEGPPSSGVDKALVA